MIRLPRCTSIVAILGMCGIANSAGAASLLEVYQQALQSDPRVHEAEARRLAALEAEPQARGVLLPQLNFTGDWTRDRASGQSTQFRTIYCDPSGDINDPTNICDFATFPAPNETRGELTRWNLTLRQSLFRWDQIVGMRRADKQVAKAQADREAAQQDLIIRVGQSYFDVLAAEDRLTSRHANRQAIARQLEQAQQRFEVGLIAITGVQESQAAYDAAVADEIQAKRDLATRREFLREITGEYVSNLSAPGEEFAMQAPNPASEMDWVNLALDQNLSLLSSRLDEGLARDEISYRRTGHYPTIELVARRADFDDNRDLRLSIGDTDLPWRQNDRSSVTDSIGIEFSVPLFSGGTTSSRVREAVYLHRAAREQLQRVTRETERATRDAYLGVLSEMSRVEALAQAVRSSRTALEATEAGFEVGTRTIVDVLNSQFALYSAITNFYQARYDYLMNVLRLKQAAGNLQVQDLEEIDQWLVDRPTPEQAFAGEESADQ